MDEKSKSELVGIAKDNKGAAIRKDRHYTKLVQVKDTEITSLKD